MKPRDLYFATHHQAAQVVTALTLGCTVGSVVPGGEADANQWCLDSASLEDVEMILASGFEIERMLGRLNDQAWARCESDRAKMAERYSDRTGLAIDPKAITERFMRGAEASRAILDHAHTRQSIEALADALSEAYESGKSTLSHDEIRAITQTNLVTQ